MPHPPSRPLLGIAKATVNFLPISLVLFAYERALTPLYGSSPTTFFLNKIVLATIFASAVNSVQLPLERIWLYVALSLSFAPNATYWVAVWSSRRKDPIWGPIITHMLVIAPILCAFTTVIMETNLRKTGKTSDPQFPLRFRLLAAVICYMCTTKLSQHLWPKVSQLRSISESQIFLGLAGIAYSLWLLQLPGSSKPRKLQGLITSEQRKFILLAAFATFWWSVQPLLTSPVLSHPLTQTYTHPYFPLQIHSSVQSTTGLIVVGEALPHTGHYGETNEEMHSMRYLRASHSILGGVWTGPKVQVLDNETPLVDSGGTHLGDSIYSTFVLQEAARMVNSTVRGKAGLWENALIIGLGTGISATAFSRHGIPTTIVEIDPAVYDAATRFFGLPDPGIDDKVFLEDARSWAAKKRAFVEAGNKEKLYDIVVHDCFSGGGVPQHIYTVEFWEDMKAVIHAESIIAVNFAGVPISESSRMILGTLEKTFGQCRAFHDLVAELKMEQYETDFVNIVFFCTQSRTPLTFRSARGSDFLGSPLRRYVLDSLPTREVQLDFIRADREDDDKYVLRDAHNPLGELQAEQALHHWTLMRQVLVDEHWETY